MNILFLGGDKRYLTIISELEKKYNVHLVGYNSVSVLGNKIDINKLHLSDYDVIFFPMSGISDNYLIKSIDGDIYLKKEDLDNISKECLIITGLITEVIKDLNTKNVISFLEDKEIKKLNTEVTVLGILDNIENKKKNILIFGYGNIGKELYDKLDKNRYDVSVLENDEDKIDNINVFDTSDKVVLNNLLNKANIIINTVPKNIINKQIIDKMNSNTYILDIASYPHGIDSNLLEEYNLDYKLYLGIPGKYKPEKSGEVLLKKVKGVLGGKK